MLFDAFQRYTPHTLHSNFVNNILSIMTLLFTQVLQVNTYAGARASASASAMESMCLQSAHEIRKYSHA